MSNPTAAQVQPIHADMVEKVRDSYLQFFEIGGAGEGIVLTAEHCRELVQLLCAQAHADQQARLRALVGTWERRTERCIEQAEKAGSRMQRESWISTEIATRNCADELEAVLGGE